MPSGNQELDLSTGERLKGALDELDKAPLLRLVIDLSRLSFLDLSEIALLVSLNKRCRENGAPRLEIRPEPPAVQRLFELAGADDRLPSSRRSGPSGNGCLVEGSGSRAGA